MDLATFIRVRRPQWKQLETILQRVEGSGLQALEDEQAEEFGRLYRCAASDLNQAQTFVSGDATVQYLNDLVARCYLVIYAKSKADPLGLLRYLFWGYPAVFRRYFRYVLLATAICLAGAVFGFLACYYDAAGSSFLRPNDFPMIEPEGQTISAATNAVPIAITTLTGHRLSTGDKVHVRGVRGNTAANGDWRVAVIDGNRFTLDGSDGTASGAYVAGSGACSRVGDEDQAGLQSTGQLQAFSSFLFTHNLGVCLIVFALGATFGIGTAWMMWSTGIMIGEGAATFLAAGQFKAYCTGILPHGVLEIPACWIAAGAGFVLAEGMIRARPWPRWQELTRSGTQALFLLAGCAPLLAAAAVLEAGVARAPDWFLSSGLKLACAGVVGLTFVMYVFLIGWGKPWNGSEPNSVPDIQRLALGEPGA
jgi:uncharacterized membrane protein SpoIIM required for sporulation